MKNTFLEFKNLRLSKRDEGQLRGTTLLHCLFHKQCTFDSITGIPASGYFPFTERTQRGVQRLRILSHTNRQFSAKRKALTIPYQCLLHIP